ncbi:MAG: NADH-quinone oxidoreductase subunit J [bacterium]
MIEAIFFYAFAVAIILGAILTVTLNNIFRAALTLAFTFTCVAGIYLMLQAPFIAAIQVLIYVGAITVLIIFAIMLTQNMAGSKTRTLNMQSIMNALICLILAFLFIMILINNPFSMKFMKTWEVADLANILFSNYLLPFEVLSILLLVALIGAIVIARNNGEDQ